jgi:hypothetical protein
LKAELEHEQRRFEALILASDNAHKQIGQLVAEHKTAWQAKATRELDRVKRRYEAAIQELAAARDELDNAATLLNWLSDGESSSAATDALAGGHGDQTMGFTRVLAELRRDAEHLGNGAPRDDRGGEPAFHLASGHGVRGMRVSSPSSGWGGE